MKKNRISLKLQTSSYENLKEKKFKNLNEKQKNKRENLLKRKRFYTEDEGIGNGDESDKIIKEEIISKEEIDNIINNMNLNSNLKRIRRISCFNEIFFKEEILKRKNFFSNLLKELESSEEKENNKFEICWILTNISTYKFEECKILINFLPTLFILFSNQNLILKEQICWIFGNLSIELEFKNILILNFNILNYLFDLLESNNKNMIKISSWCLSNIYRGASTSDITSGVGGTGIGVGGGIGGNQSMMKLNIPISKYQLNLILKFFKTSNVFLYISLYLINILLIEFNNYY